MLWIIVHCGGELLPVRNFKAAAAEVQKPRSLAASALQILVQFVVHETSFASHFDEIRILHDFQVMRDSDDFGIEQFRDIADREFAISQRVDNPEAMRITQRFQSLRTKISVKDFLCQDCSPFRGQSLKFIRSCELWYSPE